MRTKSDCAFCHKIREGTVLETNTPGVVRFEPLNPVTPGHMLFVPEVHVLDAGDSPQITGLVFAEAALYAENLPNNQVGQSFNLITSAGRHATQSIFHLHVHYVPRATQDGLHLPWTPLASY